MSYIPPDTIAKIMKALDEGVSITALMQQFPEHRAVIEEVEEARQMLARTVSAIPEPITKPLGVRLPQAEGLVESPFVINSLIFSMNYKIVVPVLVLGLIAVGGTVFLSGKGGQIAQTPSEAPIADVGGTSETSVPGIAQPDVAQPKTVPSQIATNVNDVLAAFSADIADEQVAYADGIDESMFAQSELSGFESDTYDY